MNTKRGSQNIIKAGCRNYKRDRGHYSLKKLLGLTIIKGIGSELRKILGLKKKISGSQIITRAL